MCTLKPETHLPDTMQPDKIISGTAILDEP